MHAIANRKAEQLTVYGQLAMSRCSQLVYITAPAALVETR